MSNRGVSATGFDPGPQGLAGVTVTAGLDLSALQARLACASFVVLHAALYSNFAGSAIETVLRRRFVDDSEASGTELNKTVLTTPAHALKQPECWLIELAPSPDWEAEFARILRPNMPLAEVSALYHSSGEWCQALSAAPGSRIRHATTASLPLYPVLVIDDVLLIGQYAHSQLPAASGLWFTLDTRAMGLTTGTLARWFSNGVPEAQLQQQGADGSVSLAIGRLIDECRTAALGASEQPGRALATQ